MSVTVAEAIVRHLRDAGVRAIFGVPGGGSNLDVIDAAARAGIPFVLTATETAGAIAAIAQAELAGRPGACLTGLGPGAASVVNGVACAFLDRAPLIVITDAHPASAGGRFEHQRLDQRALFSPITKWSATIAPDTVDDVMARAVAAATAPPPGPVHLELPADQSSVGCQQASVSNRPSTLDRPQAPTDGGLRTDDWLLKTVSRPLLIAGLGARRDADAIRGFVRSRGVPAMVTYKAKGVVADRDALFAGVFTNGRLERDIVAASDAIVAVGLDRVELLPRDWAFWQPVIEIQHDIAGALQQLADRLEPSAWDLDALRRAVDEQRRRFESDAGLTPDRVVRLASAAFPDARVTVDAGAHMFPATMLWPCAEPGDLLISNGLSTMGFAVPAAVGAALADRTRRVVALTGDGGLLMCAGELSTLVRERLPVVVVVFDDRSLSLIDVKQQQRKHERRGVALGDVDWRAIANAVGMRAAVADTAQELDIAFASASSGDGPMLVDVRVDASSYTDILQAVRG